MNKHPIIPVILSGGAGSRLWPVSRESHPKPFIQLPDGENLLQKTFLRASSLPNITEIITITNKAYYLKHKKAYQQIASKVKISAPLSFILEPCARNTLVTPLSRPVIK